MRFHQLPNGAAFEYQGKIYVKTGPLTAAEREGGGQRCIPRSALVGPAGPEPATADTIRGGVPETVESAIDAFCTAVFDMIDELCAEDTERRGYCKGRLDQARRQLIETLKRSG